jgi:hypothetical protein
MLVERVRGDLEAVRLAAEAREKARRFDPGAGCCVAGVHAQELYVVAFLLIAQRVSGFIQMLRTRLVPQCMRDVPEKIDICHSESVPRRITFAAQAGMTS